MPENTDHDLPETRSLATDAALVATPFAIAAQPLIGAWADQHIGHKSTSDSDEPPPQQQPQQQQQDDS